MYRHDRNGYAGELRVTIISDGTRGAIGAAGVGAAQNLPEGLIDAAGNLTSLAGGDYNLTAPVPGEHIEAPIHRLTVRRGATPISGVTFRPVETSPNVVDVLQLLAQGEALTVTPEQLIDIQAVLDALPDAKGLPQLAADARQAAADARALLQAQQGTLVYHLGTNSDGSARFYTLDPNNFKPQQVTIRAAGRDIGVAAIAGSF